ncbi:MAG: hypothetical protein HQL24_07925 [Candidatus Omnitrophica bacterium]|nr:hypothetical protein [Candidatus Omnitrophota bacterium]
MTFKNLKTWLSNSSLPTAWLSIIPVVMATSMAFGDGVQNWTRSAWTLVLAFLLQIITIDIFELFKEKFLRLKTLLTGIIFGPLLVAGSYYLQSHEMNLAVFIAGMPLGFLAMNILTLKLHQEITQKRLVLRYLSFTFIAVLMPVIIYGITNDHIYSLSACVVLLMAIKPITKLFHEDKHSLVHAIVWTKWMALVYGVLFSIGWLDIIERILERIWSP